MASALIAHLWFLPGGAAAWPLAARSRQPTMPMVGFLGSGTPDGFALMAAAFRHGLKETGFNEYRWAEGEYERLPAEATDLIQRGAAVIRAPEGGSRFQ